jgi:hypothetical protein
MRMSSKILICTGAVMAATFGWSFACAQNAMQQSCAPDPVQEGCGTFTWPDGSRYVGNFHGGFFDGPATVIYPDGAQLEVSYRSGNADSGNATYVRLDGTRVTGPFHDVSRDIRYPHPPADYPFWRALFGDSADVIVAAIVDENGFVRTARPYREIESQSYASAAVEAIRKWRYLPATVDGKPVPIPYLIDIQFSQPR